MKFKVFWGWKLKPRDIITMFHIEDADEFEDDETSLFDLLRIDKDSHPHIEKKNVDFEHSDLFDNESSNACLLGVVLNKGVGHYDCCASIPEVSDDQKEQTKKLIADYPSLANLEPRIWVYVHAEL